MGIKKFFGWCKNRFSDDIHHLKSTETISDLKEESIANVSIDNCMIDMNGLFHNSAQKAFEYGNHKPPKRLLGYLTRPRDNVSFRTKQQRMFEDVCQTIEQVVHILKPKKRLILCVDGPAPLAKQCIAKGTLVSMSNGASVPIEKIIENKKVLGWNGSGFTNTYNLGLEPKGVKDTIKITLCDGRELICTPDHQILVRSEEKTEWKNASNLTLNDCIISGIEMPEDIVGNDEKEWKLKLETYSFSMDTLEKREQTLALSRIIGYILADGYITNTAKSLTSAVSLGTRIDAEIFNEDIFLLTRKKSKVYCVIGDKGQIYSVRLPLELTRILIEIQGIPTGKRTTSLPTLPCFLLDENCPKRVIQEFLAGLFGGDGHSPCINTSRSNNGSFSSVKFSQSTIVKYKNEFKACLANIVILLTKAGVDGAYICGPYKHTYTNNLMIPKDVEENPRLKYTIVVPMSTTFSKYISFRYATNKTLRLSVANAYWRMNEKIKEHRDTVAKRTIEIFDNYTPEYKCPECLFVFSSRNCLRRHQTKRCPVKKVSKENVVLTHCTLQMALEKSQNELQQKHILLHELALSSSEEVRVIRNRGYSHTSRRIRGTIDTHEFMAKTGTRSWFINEKKGPSYAMGQESTSVPFFSLPIVDIRSNGKCPVYDIEVEENHSFLANGMCVHNCQQRKRRFVSARELANEPNRSFDSNCLTPGTKFMDYLTKYIDWYIRKQVSNPHSVWFNLEIVYSNEKNPSEGEHKLLSFLRKHGNKEESYCIYGMDADLIMLVLASHTQNFYILRENPIEEDFAYYFVDMKSYRRDLIELMKWPETKHQYKPENAINDFVFMCFTVGNDFLPHIPAIEIVEGGIDMMLNVYKTVCEEYGHLTRISSHGVRFRKNALKIFLGTLSQYEKGVLENKLAHKDMFFPDAILERNATFVNGKIELDIEQYRKEYYLQNIPELKDTNTLTEEQLCHHYLEGMQWVLSYYTKGVPDWQWKFPYHYAPFAYTIAKHIDTFEFKEYSQTFPATPFVQLLSILPPNSAHLLPYPLNSLLTSANSPLAPYCPTQFVVDVSGMMNEWEGIVLLPMIDFNTVNNICQQHIEQVDERDRRRNIVGKSFIYKRGRFSQLFKSVYGDLQSCAELKVIDI